MQNKQENLEQIIRPGWVWISDGYALEDYPSEKRPISRLAIAETIFASLGGLWIVVHWSIYPLLLTSLAVVFLT